MEYWTDLYKELAHRINKHIPEVEWIDLWHEQVSYLTTELPFPGRAVFLAFSTVSLDDIGGLAQNCDTQVDIYLFYETFSDTYFGSANQDSALEYLNTLTRLHALFHGKDGKNYSSMRRVEMRDMESGGAGNLYRISFQCLVTDCSAEKLYVETENPDAELEIEKGGIPDREELPPLFDVNVG